MTPGKTTARTGRRLPRSFRDFLLGLTLFIVVAITGLAGAPTGSGFISNAAHAQYYEIATATKEMASAFGAGHARLGGDAFRQQLLVLSSLALAFAGIFALNLWFARHLRRVHATDRRRR